MPAHRSPCAARWIALLVAATLLAGCVRTTPHVVKIGLVGPFDGRYREIGYDVIPAVRLAVREWAAAASARSGAAATVFEVVAYDDGGDPARAVEQAQALAADPDVAIVIGHWRDETTHAALPIYERAGLPVIVFSPLDFASRAVAANLSPSESALEDAAAAWARAQGGALLLMDASDAVEAAAADAARLPRGDEPIVGGPLWGLAQYQALAGPQADGLLYVSGAALPGDAAGTGMTPEQVAAFARDYTAANLGAPPGPLAIAGYQAAWLAIRLVLEKRGIVLDDTPAAAISMGSDSRRADAPIYLYRWQDGQRILVERLH